MKRIAILGVVIGALAISACTPDVIIRNSEGVTNVGIVQAEYVNSKLEIRVGAESKFNTLGMFSTQTIAAPFAASWGQMEVTSFIDKQFDMRVTTGVTYIGTKGMATKIVDSRTVTCPVGYMLGTCIAAIEIGEKEIVNKYKQEFSYLN